MFDIRVNCLPKITGFSPEGVKTIYVFLYVTLSFKMLGNH